MSFRVVVRDGPRVERLSAETLPEALDLVADRTRALAAGPRRRTIDLRARTFRPVDQVAARIEVRGPGRVRGGVDVRGDGSTEAWTGRLRRELVPPQRGESAAEALRRALQD